MLSRTQKQLVVGGVYVLVALLIGGGVLYAKYRPTCTDGIKNGKEEGVDCGTLACGKACVAPVQAPVVQQVDLIKTPAGDYDMAALVYNPNTDYGSDAITYNLVITDSTGAEVLRRSGTFYILPGQTKFIVQTSLRGIPDGAQTQVVITGVDWVKATSAQDNPFLITREAFTPAVDQTTYEAVLVNNSNFDFDTADVNIVVFNSAGNVIATNMTNLQTVLSLTSRSIKVTWPFPLPSDAHVQAEVNTNLFNNANFLKTNGVQEKFQQYY